MYITTNYPRVIGGTRDLLKTKRTTERTRTTSRFSPFPHTRHDPIHRLLLFTRQLGRSLLHAELLARCLGARELWRPKELPINPITPRLSLAERQWFLWVVRHWYSSYP